MANKIFVVVMFLCCCSFLAAQQLRIATYQYADNNRIKNIQPFADDLRKKYGYDAIVKSYPTVHALIDGIQRGEVDIALINTFGYLLLETSGNKYPMKPVLTLEVREDAKDNYKTAIIASINSPIHSLAEIKKFSAPTRLMLVAKGSTSGNLVPRLALSGQGIPDPEKSFASVQYAGNHSLAVEKVLTGQADIACMGHTEYDKAGKDSLSNNKIKLIWLSPEIPLGPVLFHKNMDPALATIIEKAFLVLHIENPAALESVKAGWSEAKQAIHYIRITDTYYDSFRKTFGRKKELQRILRQFID